MTPAPAVNWRQAELEALWFPIVEEAEYIRRTERLSWVTIADARLKIGESTLRYWRKRYWQAKQAQQSSG